LDVSGATVISGNVGVGRTNPSVALDVSGYVKSTLVGFYATRTTASNVNIPTESQITNTQLNNTLHNYSNAYNNGTFTAPVNGLYWFSATFNAGIFSIRKNATAWNNGTGYGGGFTTSGSNSCIATVIPLDAGDNVKVFTHNPDVDGIGSADINRCPASYFCGYLINTL
jgi:hypothetical protein